MVVLLDPNSLKVKKKKKKKVPISYLKVKWPQYRAIHHDDTIWPIGAIYETTYFNGLAWC